MELDESSEFQILLIDRLNNIEYSLFLFVFSP